MLNALRKSRLLAILFCSLTPALPASAATVWDESASGDLASDPAAPTAVSFATGSNVVAGDVNSTSDIRDYFTFVLAPDQSLTAITLLSYTGNVGFTAINSGPTSFIPDLSTIEFFLGGAHTNRTLVGTSLLTLLTGFDTPLGPGSYTYLIQQTSGELTSYALDFAVSPVPAPAAVWLLGSALLGVAVRRGFR